MRYKQFLNEGYNPHAEELLKGVQVVYTHCMPFIKDLIKGGFNYLTKADDLLYSGRNENSSIIIKNVRNDRKPTDTDEDHHNIFDDILYKKFKVRSRSNAIFCTGNLMTAGDYGSSVYIIFPTGKYEVIWSDTIKDIYKSDAVRIIERWEQKYKTYRSKKIFHSNPVEIDDKLKKYPWNFFTLPKDNEFYMNMMKDLEKDFFSTYHKGDIMKAIDSNHEIMLTCKRYIGLKHMDYNRVIKQYIEQNKTKFPDKDFFYEWYERYIG